MKKNRLILLFVFLSGIAVSQEKYALIVGISDYGYNSGFGRINTELDVKLMKEAFLKQGFKAENITVLVESNATKVNVINAFNKKIIPKIKNGDIVGFHFSGHGQQMWDQDNDEADGWDESLVCFGAKAKFSENYKGESHIRDDELKIIIQNLREKAGKTGNVFFSIDACYSGNIERGGGSSRGALDAFKPQGYVPKTVFVSNNMYGGIDSDTDSNIASFIVFSGSLESEKNKESRIKAGNANEGSLVGTLSYALYLELTSGESIKTYRELFDMVKSQIGNLQPRQTPVAEGNLDINIFGGTSYKYIKYYQTINYVDNTDTLRINGGLINNIYDGAKLGIYIIGTEKIDTLKRIASAVVKNASTFESEIEVINSKLLKKPINDYWIFVEDPGFNEIKTNIYVKFKSTQEYLDTIKNNSNIIIVNDDKFADIIISDSVYANKYFLNFYDTKYNQRIVKEIKNDLELIGISYEVIGYYNKRRFLREFKAHNNNYKIDFVIEPISNCHNIDSILPIENFINNGQIIFNKNQCFKLRLMNSGNMITYFQILVFKQNGGIEYIGPYKNEKQFLIPGATDEYLITNLKTDESGQEYFKIICSDVSLEELAVLISNMKKITLRGTHSRFEDIINSFPSGKRSKRGNINNENFFTTEFTLITNK